MSKKAKVKSMKTMDRFNSDMGASHVLARRLTAAWLVAGIALALAQPARAGRITASGGTELYHTQNGTNYHAHIFSTTGTDTFTVTQGGEMEVLVVAGGGGGGQWNAGGGGAGGLIYTSTVVDAGSYSVTVGSGGAGGVGGVNDEEGRSGSNGSDSAFGALTAIGGGGGGAYAAGLATSGGSGGGSAWNDNGVVAGTAGQGHAGGAGQGPASGLPYAGAGGGGAGDVGGSANPGNGGAGLYYAQFAVAGSPAGWFAGGGGGGGNSGSGAGGIGGGGAGQNGTSPSSGGISGVAGTGGGGGGGGGTKEGPGGPGGSGIVIIQYPVLTASGGTEMSYTENGTNYHAHIFAAPGTSTFTVTQGGEMEVLVVAGGGGGGQWNAGGGGAGGLIYTSTVVDAGSYSVTVGSGGAGGVGGVDYHGNSGSNGSNSEFGALIAIGGGGGGAYDTGLATSGGSGGGSAWNNSGVAAGTAGQGHDGGAGQWQSSGEPYAGAGGGGAGAVGGSANPGSGGAGLEFPQFAALGGSPAGWFAGGGGGGGNGWSDGSGGSGAGGIGGGGAGQSNATPASGGLPGVAGTGGGGGGGGATVKGPGGAGGSGIVIVRYVVPQLQVDNWALATGGTETDFMENGTNYHAHIFTATGPNTLYVMSPGAVEYLVVGGGGAGRGNGGGVNSGSGGNGGQFRSGILYTVPAGVLSVTVGAGGVGVAGASGTPGGDSAFWTLTAAGGAGGSFGSSSVGTYGGNGAGGAGAGQADGPLGNAGGPGFASTILGTSVMYAGGGGGGFSHGGNGGSGGGGRGESYDTGTAENGAANTGGGGGGVSNGGATPGKNGGSGIVIVRYQRPLPSDNLINLDINGYGPGGDPVPVTAKTCYGAAAVGAAGDFWNSAAIAESTFETLAAPLLKTADGVTSTTVRFTLSKPNGLLHADWRHEPGYAVNGLLDDYVYILPGDTPASDTFTISGLVPNAAYDLYFYSHAGIEYAPGRFTINNVQYDSIYNWATTGDYAKCLGIAADGNGVITGTFSQADPNNSAVLNGLQIVGTFPVSQAEIVNIDLNGFYLADVWSKPSGAGSTYVGGARVGGVGDYWNGVAVLDGSTNVTAPNLKLANGVTNTAVRFSLSSTVVGGKLHGNGRTSLNVMLSDYVFITDGTAGTDGSSDRFTISGLVPNAAYDLYFYCHEYDLYNPGRFMINGKTYDSIDTSFPASGGGDTAVCAGITADGNGQITGEFSQAAAPLPVVVNGLQIVGAFPRRQADLVNIDINGYGPGDDPPPVEGDTYSGAARVGADGDYWNGLAIGTETVTNITVSRLKFADGATKSRVSFTIGRVDGLLNADRIVPEVYLNALMGDYVYYYDGTGTFTIAGLYANTAYDLYFYCGAGSLYFPVRFEINGATYNSFDHWFEGSPYSDYAVCAGIVADGNGSITGTIYKATPDSATCVSGVQIMGKIPPAPQGTILIFE